MAAVALAFPPLVESNFGLIYPSTAVLAAYLESQGVGTKQIDLNARFLDHVLGEQELLASSEERYARSTLWSVAAATWTRRHLVDGSLTTADFLTARDEGGHPLDNIARFLVYPYSVDPGPWVLDAQTDDPVLSGSYARFFAAHVEELVPAGSEPMLLGISVPMGPQLMPALELAAVVRAIAGPGTCRIVLGGPTLSLLDHADLDRLLTHHPAVDCIVRFDGEHALHALAEQVAADRWAPHHVPGTSSLLDGAPVHVAPDPGPNLDLLPTPMYSGPMVADAPRAALSVLQARGCYWGKCDYCDFVEVFQGSPPYRGRRAELVVDDIRALVEQTGLRRFRVITESIPPAFARRFSSLLSERRVDIRWSSFAMVDRRFDSDLLRRMADSGCEFLVIGLESMVTRALKLVHKSADREENIRFLRQARAAGIRLSVNLIPNLPSTTWEEAIRGLRDLEALADCMDHVKIFEFEATRSSRVGRSPANFGLTSREEIGRSSHAQLTINTLPAEDLAMSAEELRDVFSAYRAFAAQVNAQPHEASEPVPVRGYVEAVGRPDGPVLLNFTTMERLDFPPVHGSPPGRGASSRRTRIADTPAPT